MSAQMSSANFASVITALPSQITVNFALNATVSTTLDCNGMQPRILILPATWTACTLTFQVARALNDPNHPDMLQFLYNPDNTGKFSIVTVASAAYPLIPWYFDAVRYIQLTSSTPQLSATSAIIAPMPLYQGNHV